LARSLSLEVAMLESRPRLLAATTLALACAAASAPGAEPRAMTIVDLLNVPRISAPQLSPDGRQVLYVLSAADWKADKRVGHVFRVNVDGSGLLQMTNGSEGESSPRWSPDGRELAFLAKRGADEATQIYLMGNAGGEARALTRHATAVSEPAWSPDGSALYFTAPEPKTAAEKAKDKAKDDVYAFDENYKQKHLWRVSVADGTERRITEGDDSVLAYQLSRDGRSIALERSPDPLYGDFDKSEVYVMDADGSHAVRITRNSVPESGASLSPDGKTVLFTAEANAAFETYYNAKVFLAPAMGGASRVLVSDFPYEIEDAAWSKDGSQVYALVNMGVHSELFAFDAASGRPRQLSDGKHALRGWSYSPESDQHVLTVDDPESPGDVALLPAGGGTPRQVSHVFDHLARDFRLPRQERIEWKGADGTTIEGLLFYPLDYEAGRRYPLVVQTHGGPQSSDQYGFSGGWGSYVQVLTAKGYAVLKPNYRGSTGYGDRFLRDMVGHYFRNAHLDVMAGVDEVIALGVADPERLAKMGWSAGGHMTNKIITFTDRFKAASSGAGAANWISMYAESDVRLYRTPWFGGTPWQKNAPIDAYWDNSPLKYVANVKTPTLFLVGERDPRVPMPQSVEMYRALKSNGVPTHLYVAPREPHGWQELRHELFKVNVELDWFEKYVTGRPYVWEKAPEQPKADESDSAQQDRGSR
jgi:dipeptidyl aminopeptidase/acylaminoacyl peptidase